MASPSPKTSRPEIRTGISPGVPTAAAARLIQGGDSRIVLFFGGVVHAIVNTIFLSGAHFGSG
jgi:hypothetical protein